MLGNRILEDDYFCFLRPRLQLSSTQTQTQTQTRTQTQTQTQLNSTQLRLSLAQLSSAQLRLRLRLSSDSAQTQTQLNSTQLTQTHLNFGSGPGASRARSPFGPIVCVAEVSLVWSRALRPLAARVSSRRTHWHSPRGVSSVPAALPFPRSTRRSTRRTKEGRGGLDRVTVLLA